MELVIVRHAVAFDRDSTRWPDDDDRPLSPEGMERFRRVARGLGRVVPEVSALYASPLVRARQTAEILQAEAHWPSPQLLDALRPEEHPETLLATLRRAGADECIAVVGHEPHLHDLVGFLACGRRHGLAVDMKKGGAATISFTGGDVGPGAGRLEWLLPPKTILKLL